MPKIAIIGFGAHIRKNILPAISRMQDTEVEAIYTRKPEKHHPTNQSTITIKTLEEIPGNEVEWVYIATPISTHFDLTKKYLNLGKNVICEKPITETTENTKALFDLARKKGLQLHEVQMYKFHKQYTHLKHTIEENRSNIKTFRAKFTIPHLNQDDIRYKKELGGGALMDVGFYPISIIISLFGLPDDIKPIKFSEDKYDVDLFGAALLDYNHFYCIAEWGIGLAYTNEVSFTINDKHIIYERIFSKPHELSTSATIIKDGNAQKITIGPDDHFVNMLNYYLTQPQSEQSNIINTQEIISYISGR